MSLIPFPAVPQVPGVPAVFRNATIPSLGALVNSVFGGVAAALFGVPVWGVFDQGGGQVLFPDSFLGIDYKNDYRVSSYPQEQGAFASYNKVGTPYDCRIRMTIGGDQASRAAFLATIDRMLKAIDLYSVITPEATYINATLQNYNYRRTDKNGATLLTVDLWFLEVRETAVALFAGTQTPAGADSVSSGNVQTFPVDSVSSVSAPNLVLQ